MVPPRTWEELALNSGSLASDQCFFLPVPWLIAAGGRLRFALGVSRSQPRSPECWDNTMGRCSQVRPQLTHIQSRTAVRI